jgi:hypothetical protein
LVHVDFHVGFGEDCKHQMAHRDEILAESVTDQKFQGYTYIQCHKY